MVEKYKQRTSNGKWSDTMGKDNKGQTNADALADLEERKMRKDNDGTPLLKVHTNHLEPDDLAAEVDTSSMRIVEYSGGAAIWGKIPAPKARKLSPLGDPYTEESSR